VKFSFRHEFLFRSVLAYPRFYALESFQQFAGWMRASPNVQES